MSSSNIKNVIKNNFYVLKLIFKASPTRLFFSITITSLKSLVNVLFNAVVLRQIINGVQQSEGFFHLISPVVFIFIYQVIISILESIYFELYVPFSDKKIQRTIHLLLFEKAAAVDLECFENSDFYDKYVRAISQVNTCYNQVLTSLTDVVTCIITLFSMSFVIFSIDYGVLIFALIPCIVSLLFGNKLNTIKYDLYKESQVASRKGNYVNRVFFLTDYAKELRVYNIDKVLINIFNDSVIKMKELIKRKGKLIGGLEFILISSNDILSYFGAILYTSYKTISKKTMLYGDCVFIINSITSVSQSLRGIIEILLKFQNNSLYIENLRYFLEYAPKIAENNGSKINHLVEFEFRNVTFKYTGQHRNALENININIKSGEKVAIIGTNGSGKTTLIKLLLHLYEPTNGQILLNGQEISSYSLNDYRNLFSVVFQDYKLYPFNIAENVFMNEYRKEGQHRILQQNLELVKLAKKINILPSKEHSMVTREFDDNGVLFSGGEGQKIAVARCLAKNSEVLILDEPTSAIDPISEQQILNEVIKENKSKTMIFISHRLSVTKFVDKIYLLENGVITESGTHNQLIEKKGKYANMWLKQSEKYKKESI